VEKDKVNIPEKREFNRILYNPQKRPKIQIDTHAFEIVDISEKGLGLVNDKKVPLDVMIQGKLTFLCGESVDIAGTILWEQDNILGIQFDSLIPSDKITKELLHLISND
jgi:hypothetical protein